MKNALVRLVSKEVENLQKLNFQTLSQRDQILAIEPYLRRLEKETARLVSKG